VAINPDLMDRWAGLPPGLFLIIEIVEFLAANVIYDKAAPMPSNRPGRREAAGGHQPEDNRRAAASALSSGRVLKSMAAVGAALWTALTIASKSARL
jgi:hypothetical protein